MKIIVVLNAEGIIMITKMKTKIPELKEIGKELLITLLGGIGGGVIFLILASWIFPNVNFISFGG